MSRIDVALTKLPLLNVFSSKKMIRNQVLNRLGAQPFRIWLADKRYHTRPKYLMDDIAPYIQTLQDKGVVTIPDFLPQDLFEQLEKECHSALEHETLSRVREDGPNLYTNIMGSQLSADAYPTLAATFKNEKIERLFKAAERRDVKLEKIVNLLSCLVQGEDNGKQDPETKLHEDTFHNTHKAWLYITDVELPHAPFVYVKDSHKHSLTGRIKKSYEYSLKKDSIHSRRISKEELEELNLKETVFTAKKNTFVIANTLGFHRRLRGEAGNKRVALAFSARFNPFI